MFNFLVAQNERAPDPRVGSNPALGGTYDSLPIAVVIGFLHYTNSLLLFASLLNGMQLLRPEALPSGRSDSRTYNGRSYQRNPQHARDLRRCRLWHGSRWRSDLDVI